MKQPIPIKESTSGVSFAVRVHPRAKRDRISGVLGDALKLEITAPPVEGRANDAVVAFFAEFLRVPRSSVTIAAGQSSRNKVVRVAGLSAEVVEQRIATALADPKA